MINRSWLAWLFLLLGLTFSFDSPSSLEHEIILTRRLIDLYTRKLSLLTQLHPTPASSLPSFSSNLVHLRRWNGEGRMIGDRWLALGGRVVQLEGGEEEFGEYMGDVIVAEEQQLTVLVGGRVATLKMGREQGQVMVGVSGEQLPSMWHRNLNIVGQQDLLLQWQGHRLWLQGRQRKQFQLNKNDSILNVYSINQYKVLLVGEEGLTVLNTRSFQRVQTIPVGNISHKTGKRVVGSGWYQGVAYLVLSGGQLARYSNGRVVSVESLPSGLALERGVSVHCLPPYIFLANSAQSKVGVVVRTGGQLRHLTNIGISLASNTSLFWFKQSHQTVKMIVSSPEETHLYQLVLPAFEQPTNSFGIIKAVGVATIVVAVVFYRMRKQTGGGNEKVVMGKRGERGEGRRGGREGGEEFGGGRMGEGQVDSFLRRNKKKVT